MREGSEQQTCQNAFFSRLSSPFACFFSRNLLIAARTFFSPKKHCLFLRDRVLRIKTRQKSAVRTLTQK